MEQWEKDFEEWYKCNYILDHDISPRMVKEIVRYNCKQSRIKTLKWVLKKRRVLQSVMDDKFANMHTIECVEEELERLKND